MKLYFYVFKVNSFVKYMCVCICMCVFVFNTGSDGDMPEMLQKESGVRRKHLNL